MIMPSARPYPTSHRGTAAVECAIMVSFIVLPLFMITVDFARLFYHYTIITNCARNGVIWASDPYSNTDTVLWGANPPSSQSPYSNLLAAVTADAGDLSPAPSIGSADPVYGTDSNGNTTATVTVTYDFSMLSPFLLGYMSFPISRTETMRVLPFSATSSS